MTDPQSIERASSSGASMIQTKKAVGGEDPNETNQRTKPRDKVGIEIYGF